MNGVQEVTAKEMVEFIMSQPDEKLIDYSESFTSNSCGCLMVQYGKHAGFNFKCVGLSSWMGVSETVAVLADGLAFCDFGRRLDGPIVTFGETKKYCRLAFPQFC